MQTQEIQGLQGVIYDRVGAPTVRIAVVAEITVSGRDDGHSRGTRRLDAARIEIDRPPAVGAGP